MNAPRMLVQLDVNELKQVIREVVLEVVGTLHVERPEYLTRKQVAALLHCTERNVGLLVARGRLEETKVANGKGSSRALIPRASVESLLGKDEA